MDMHVITVLRDADLLAMMGADCRGLIEKNFALSVTTRQYTTFFVSILDG